MVTNFLRLFKKVLMFMSTFLPSGLRVLIYRSLGYRIGKRVRISFMTILVADDIVIDDYSEIKPLTMIKIRRLQMGRYAVIASLSAVFGEADLIMSDRSRVGHANILDCTNNIFLGHYCGLGPRNTLYTHASWLPITEGYPNNRRPIKLGDYIWTGISNTIFPGTTIQNHVFTYANMVLSGNIPGNCFITPEETFPIEKIKKSMSIEKIIEKMVLSIAEKVSVYYPNGNLEAKSIGDCDIIIISSLKSDFIDKSFSLSKPILAFLPQMSENDINRLNELKIDWYDFETLTMSKFFHKYKTIVMKQLAALGGLRFIEK